MTVTGPVEHHATGAGGHGGRGAMTINDDEFDGHVVHAQNEARRARVRLRRTDRRSCGHANDHELSSVSSPRARFVNCFDGGELLATPHEGG